VHVTYSASAANVLNKFSRVFVCLVFVFLIVFDLMPVLVYRAKKVEIERLVPVGTSMANAESILLARGYHFEPKHFPTNEKDKWWIDVNVSGRRSITIGLLRIVGLRFNVFDYIVIESGLDGIVRRVF